MKEKLIIIRNFLYRLFIIGFILNIISQIPFVLVKMQSINEAAVFLGVPPYYLMELLITSITVLRIILVYFILCPALALHWTIARDKSLSSAPVEEPPSCNLG